MTARHPGSGRARAHAVPPGAADCGRLSAMSRSSAGAEPRTVRIGRVRVVIAPPEEPPFRFDAEVVEEDTYLVLSAGPEAIESDVHPLRVLQAAHDARPVAPGSVVAQPGPPLRLLAVVHDLAQEPTWREEWIAEALAAVMREVRKRQVRALTLPVLGARHGRMPAAAFAGLLRRALEAETPPSLARLWIRAAGEIEDMAAVLKAGRGAGGVLRRGPWPGSG